MTLPLERDKRHKLQAVHNQELLGEKCFSDGIAQTSLKYNDWFVTVTFYIALHHFQTYLARNRLRASFDSHTERNDYLKALARTDRRVNKVISKYISLYKLSRLSRYNPCYFTYLKATDVKKYLTFAVQELKTELGI
jgi:hypothetical protein